MPPEARAWLETMGHGGGGLMLLVIGFLFHLVLGCIFATLGGLLGAMMFRKDAPPMVPPAGPPPMPPPLPPTI